MDVQFLLDGEAVRCPAGLTVAAALYHLGRNSMRWTSRLEAPRALFCGMGVCYDCVLQIDGVPSTRSCCVQVQAGMQVVTQHGDTSLDPGCDR